MSARDRYQRTAKERAVADVKCDRRAAWLQVMLAGDTIARCRASPNRDVPGTFAHDVVARWLAEGDPTARRLESLN